MSKRDYIQEIISKKQRASFERLKGSINLYELEADFQAISESNRNIKTSSSIYLVGIAACLEIAARYAIKTFVDSGAPYIERIPGFKDSLKFDLNITKALHDKQVTFGELISHLLPINNVENINSHFGVLLDKNFSFILSEIREFQEPSDEELLGSDDEDIFETGDDEIVQPETQNTEEPPFIISDVNALMASLERLFRYRHIVAHEANFESVSESDLLEFFGSARIFIDALEEIVEQTLNPGLPRNSFGLSLVNAEIAGKIYTEMEGVYKKLHDLVSSEKDKYLKPAIRELEEANEAFDKYLELESIFEEALFSPINGNAMRNIYSHVQGTLCKQRLERLNELLELFEFSDDEIN